MDTSDYVLRTYFQVQCTQDPKDIGCVAKDKGKTCFIVHITHIMVVTFNLYTKVCFYEKWRGRKELLRTNCL